MKFQSSISSLRDYTVLSHFQCFSMETWIVYMKVLAHDFGPEICVIIRPETIPSNIVGSQCVQFIIIKKWNLFWDKILLHWKSSKKLVLHQCIHFLGVFNLKFKFVRHVPLYNSRLRTFSLKLIPVTIHTFSGN